MVSVKKLIALLVLAVLVCGSVVGCSSPTSKSGGGGTPVTTKP
jgi:hypothetical protein